MDSINLLVRNFYHVSHKEHFEPEPDSFFANVALAEDAYPSRLLRLKRYRAELGNLCKNLVENYSVNFWKDTPANLELLQGLRASLHFHREVFWFINYVVLEYADSSTDLKFIEKVKGLVDSLREGHVDDVCEKLNDLKGYYLWTNAAAAIDCLIERYGGSSVYSLRELRVFSLSYWLMIRDGLIGVAGVFSGYALLVNIDSRLENDLGGCFLKGSKNRWIEFFAIAVCAFYVFRLGLKILYGLWATVEFQLQALGS